MRVYGLKTNARAEPREIDCTQPTFTWRLHSPLTGDDPLRTHIAVEKVGVDGVVSTVWEAEVPASDRAIHYEGERLEARTSYSWVITVVSTGGREATATGRFETGMQDASEWSAKWIARNTVPEPELGEHPPADDSSPIPRSFRTMYSSAPIQVRHAFNEPLRVARARLYVSARGVYIAYLNGCRIGHDELTPGWTRYESRIEYQAYDVTSLVGRGPNVLAAVVGDGWWSGYLGYNTRSQADQYGAYPEFIAELHLEFDDGTSRVVATGPEWTECAGAVVMSDLLMGEYHEPAQDSGGWTAADFDDSAWRPVVVAGIDTSVLSGQLAEPVRILDCLPAVSVTTNSAGNHVVDFGQNLVGRVRLVLRDQPAGQVIELFHGEMLDGDAVYTANLRTAESRDVVVTSGGASQLFEPYFALHGFRFLELRGMASAPRISDVTAVVLGSDNTLAGGFSTGNPLVNQLQSNIVWSQRGNFVAVPTDCPQRDERLGWTADTQIFSRTAVYNADVHAFLDRWLRDLVASQEPSGRVPDLAPIPPTSRNFDHGAPGWADAIVIVPWTLYEAYGDAQLLARYYPHMQAWVEYVARCNPDSLWTAALGNNYGDWLSVGADTPRALVAGAYRIRSVDLLGAAAHALGRHEDAARYRRTAQQLRELFVETFVDDDDRVQGSTQSGYLFALAWDLLPEARRQNAAAHLVDEIERSGRRLTTGFLGANLLCPVLERIGRPDLAVALLLQREFPSWGYSIDRGATTIWERWDGWTEAAGFQAIAMNSFNHYSLGSVGEWLYRSIGGIDQAYGSVGYHTVRIAPLVVPELSPVKTWLETPRGRVEVEWRVDTTEVRLRVEIPPGTNAEIAFGDVQMQVGAGNHECVSPLNAFPLTAAVSGARSV